MIDLIKTIKSIQKEKREEFERGLRQGKREMKKSISEFTCENCKAKLKNLEEVNEHSIKFKHHSYRNKEMKGMRLLVG